MSPRRTRRGTARENISEICNNNSFKSTKISRSSRRINKSQSVKGSEDDSDNPGELNSSLGSVSTIISSTSSNKKKQKRKAQEVLVNEDSTLNVTIKELSNKSRTRKKPVKTPKATGKTKKLKFETVDVNSLISEDESFTKSQLDEKQLSNINNLISEDESVSEPVTRRKLKPDSKISSALNQDQGTPEKSPNELINRVIFPDTDITPKSSPLNISFTPHRSTKTPKKSPINLGSPKTHTHMSSKLLNVQRRLSIVDSPSSSDLSNKSFEKNTSVHFSDDIFESSKKKSKSKNSRSSSGKKKSTSPLIKKRPKFSKSPKIVFRTPKSKSNKLKKTSSKKLSVSPTKSKKSPNPNASLTSENSSSTSSSTKSKKKRSSSSKSGKISKPLLTSEELAKTENLPFVSLIKFDSSLMDLALKNKSSINISLLNTSVRSPVPNLQLNSTNSSKSVSKKSDKLPSKATSLEKSKISPMAMLTSKNKKSPLISKKMPKIVLIKKKSKSVSPSKANRLSNVTASKTKKTLKITPQKSEKMSVTLPTKKSIDSNKLTKNSSVSPRVIVKKLSSPELNNSRLSAKENQPIINLVPINHIQVPANSKDIPVSSSDHSSSSSVKKQSVNKSETSKKSIKSKGNTFKSYANINLNSNKNTPSDILDKKSVNLKSTNTSTPREKIKQPFSLASSKKKISLKSSSSSVVFNGSSTPKPKSMKKLSQSNIKMLLDDESEPSLNDSSLIPMSDLFDSDVSKNNDTYEISESNLETIFKSSPDMNVSKNIDNDNNAVKSNSSATKVKSVKDDTYDLENSDSESKVKSNKRTLNEQLGLDEEPESKKNYRVHFANCSVDNQLQSNTINRISTPAHGVQQRRTPISINRTKTPNNQSYINKMQNRRVSSVSNLHEKKSENISVNKRRSNSLIDTSKSRKSIHEAQIMSINRLSRPKPVISSEKKLGVKTPVTKKIPNFTEIHQKNFAKMESIIDLKKRVEKRHITLNTGTPSAKKSILKLQSGSDKTVPTETTNGVYNKFGYKVRKHDAVTMVSNKQARNIESREKKRETARDILKGVRMNRRFELQMKCRIKNS